MAQKEQLLRGEADFTGRKWDSFLFGSLDLPVLPECSKKSSKICIVGNILLNIT